MVVCASREPSPRLAWLKARREVLIPVTGLPLFLMMVPQMGVSLTGRQTVLLWSGAIVYASLVLWSPLALPEKVERPVTWQRVGRAALLVAAAVVGAVLLQSAVYRPSSEPGSGGGMLTLLLAIVVGTAGVVGEGTLPVDLFPLFRRTNLHRLLYVVVAALFIMVITQLWTELFGGVALAIGSALGETAPESQEAASYFDAYSPLELFVTHLVSAGLEELLFRVGVLTTVWALLLHRGMGGRGAAWLGIVISAVCFGVYHVTLSGLSDYFLRAPVTAVLQSFGAGLANAVIYRYRGYAAAVLVHALGNWLFLMLFLQAG